MFDACSKSKVGNYRTKDSVRFFLDQTVLWEWERGRGKEGRERVEGGRERVEGGREGGREGKGRSEGRKEERREQWKPWV